MKKSVLAAGIIAILSLGLVAYAQSSWIGTDWISSGSTVSSESLKSNLDFLYQNKAHKPSNCTGSEEFLGWQDGEWTCISQVGPSNCSFNGTTVSNGDNVTAYERPVVAHNESCIFESRTCSNGVLSGSFQAPDCFVSPASSCVLETLSSTINVDHGDEVFVYQYATVPFGETCQSENRVCDNGTLSGSYLSETCTVSPASECVFAGNTIASGGDVTAYATENVPYVSTCESERRVCSNGTMSGSYEFETCEVDRLDPATFRTSDFVEQITEYKCYVANILGGGYYTNRDANNECPGLFSSEVELTSYVFEGNSSFTFRNSTVGLNSDGLASDNATLNALCDLKDYDYVVGHANRDRNGFRELTSPGNNSLIYNIGGTWQIRGGEYINQTFNGDYGYVTCSDTAPSGGGIGGGSGGGGAGTTNTPRTIQQN